MSTSLDAGWDGDTLVSKSLLCVEILLMSTSLDAGWGGDTLVNNAMQVSARAQRLEPGSFVLGDSS